MSRRIKNEQGEENFKKVIVLPPQLLEEAEPYEVQPFLYAEYSFIDYVQSRFVWVADISFRRRKSLNEDVDTEGEQGITRELADGYAYGGKRNIGAHQSENNGYSLADDGQEGEEPHPCAAAGEETLCTVKLFLLYVEVFLNPVNAPEGAYPIVEHAAEGIAYRAVNNELPRVEPRCHEREHDEFAAQREYASCKKSGYKHTDVSVVDEKIY